MLANLLYFFYYFGLLIGIPIAGTLFGGLLDYGNRSMGNYRNDLPSTVGFLTGLLIDFYIMLDSTVMVVSVTSAVVGFFFLRLRTTRAG